jgi:hypothetical protein
MISRPHKETLRHDTTKEENMKTFKQMVLTEVT